MIHPAGCFNYHVALRRESNVLIGQAAPGAPGLPHPGLVGSRPRLTLADGVVTLRCMERDWPVTPACPEWFPPAHETSFEVGDAIEHVAEDGDILQVARDGCGDVGAILQRQQRTVLALGDVRYALRDEVAISEDPRLNEEHLRQTRRQLAEPDTTFVWIDVEDPGFEPTLRRLKELRGRRLVVAYRARNSDESTALNHRIAEKSLNFRNWSSMSLVEVDARFKRPEEWLTYVRAQPTERPNDLYVRFAVKDIDVELRQRGYAFCSPWHFYVYRIRRMGVPGRSSQLGVAREHPRLSENSIKASTKAVAQGLRQITNDEGTWQVVQQEWTDEVDD